MKDYSKLHDITITNQAELDEVPLDFKGSIYIDCEATVRVGHRYYFSVVAWENSSVEARGNSSVEARGNSSVEARGNSSVVAWENSSVVAWGNSSVEARENSSVVARENSSVVAWGNSSVEARENSSVVARENSSVVARGNSSVEARENSSVVARENSSVVARENSSVVARGNSSVVARGNTQVVDRQVTGKIQLSSNARTVYMPKTIHELIDFYGSKHTKTTAIFYKAVHKYEDNTYHSSQDKDFTYSIGDTASNKCDTDTDLDCSYGLHVSHLSWALDYGRYWDDLAILEAEVKIKDIVMPKNTDGKVRVPELTVLREVPLEECGLYGKILAKRRWAKDE